MSASCPLPSCFFLGGGGVVLLSLPQICREILLVPGEASHRTDRLPPAAVIEGMKKKQEGSVQFSTPPMQQNEGVYISPLLAASTNHVAFYSSIITGFEGRKKRNKTFHVFCRSGCVSRMLSFVAGLKLLFVRCRMYQMLTFAFLGICFARRLIRVCLLRRLGTSLCFQLHLECADF